MKKLFIHPLFLVGIGIRLTLIFGLPPPAVVDWYAPFLETSVSPLQLDPWLAWLDRGGSPAAFPYGYAMWIIFLPFTLLCDLLGIPLHIGYASTVLAVDISLLTLLVKLIPGRELFLLSIYWLSPIIIIASYALGLNDLIPVLFLVLSLYFTRQLNFFLAGFFCVLAVSAKLSMLLALPFFAVYILHSPALHRFVASLVKGGAVASVAVGIPFLFSDSALQMLFGNPEMDKVYQFVVRVGENLSIYVAPLAYLVMLYAAWRVRRMNFELFQSTLGIAFLAVILLTPASPGWFIWTIPLLVNYQAKSGRAAIILVGVFSGLYVAGILLNASDLQHGLWGIDTISPSVTEDLEPQLPSLLHTVMTAVGMVLAMRIWREEVSRNDYFRLSRRPFVIGIAGDSGSGKDTLSKSLEVLFGTHSVATLSGDDYHLWDRQKPIWNVMTHLNPMTNDLEGFTNDLIDLIDGKTITLRHYNHETGIRSEKTSMRSKDFIIVSGLHALYLPILRRCFSLSIYLDIDERLRRHFKQLRDVGQRGHSIQQVLDSFERRESDSRQFIRPQAEYADLILSLRPIDSRLIEESKGSEHIRLKLVARSRNGLSELSLTRVLVGVCGLHVDVLVASDTGEVELTIEGETSAEDVALASEVLCPRVMEFMDTKPKWEDGVLGLMQLITLSHINQALTKRFI